MRGSLNQLTLLWARFTGAQGRLAGIARGISGAAVFTLVVVLIFDPPLPLFIFGGASGALYGLMAVGVILIYRTNRIINFAVAGLGAVPAITAVLLQSIKGWSYWVILPLAVFGGLLIGALADIVIIRRFSKAPRLILTVATLGLVQILAFISIYIPQWLGSSAGSLSTLPTPWQGLQVRRANGALLFNGDYLFAFGVVLGLTLGLEIFFRKTRIGIALRASAENADRALLLGIPVLTVGTVAWMLAGLFASVTIFLRAPLVGVPIDGSLGYNILMYVLAAAVVARMDNIPLALAAGVGIGILEQSSVFKTGDSSISTAIMLVLILGSMLLQKGRVARAYAAGVETWQAVKEFRPVPLELRKTKEVLIGRSVLGAIVLAAAIGAPFAVGEASIPRLTLIPIYAIVAVSLVILTGWAGQISLGQFALVGAGAVVAGKLAADYDIDFFVALPAGAVAGALLALLVGIPALRVAGLYLAVTTLALAGAMHFFILNDGYAVGKALLPSGDFSRIVPPLLWERIDLTDPRNFYYFSLFFLAIVMLTARSFRRNRSGRVLIAVRDNARAAPAYGINLARSKLAAFAISGAMASVGGVLLAYHQGAIDPATYGIVPSINIFMATVIGGLTSLPGAVLGAVVIQGVQLFGERMLSGMSLLVTGPGLLFVLLLLPGGFAEGLYRLRDKALRWIANRHDILVPSLVADRRVVEAAEAEAMAKVGALRDSERAPVGAGE